MAASGTTRVSERLTLRHLSFVGKRTGLHPFADDFTDESSARKIKSEYGGLQCILLACSVRLRSGLAIQYDAVGAPVILAATGHCRALPTFGGRFVLSFPLFFTRRATLFCPTIVQGGCAGKIQFVVRVPGFEETTWGAVIRLVANVAHLIRPSCSVVQYAIHLD